VISKNQKSKLKHKEFRKNVDLSDNHRLVTKANEIDELPVFGYSTVYGGHFSMALLCSML
jgi:hypothetical protein